MRLGTDQPTKRYAVMARQMSGCNAAARLKGYRQYAAGWNDGVKRRGWGHEITWRDGMKHHRSRFARRFAVSWNDEHTELYVDDFDLIGEDLGKSHELSGDVKHAGWYATEDASEGELVIGHVVQVRCPRGTLYVPGIEWSESCGVTLIMGDAVLIGKGDEEEDNHHDAELEAALLADECARITAERDREARAEEEEQEIDSIVGKLPRERVIELLENLCIACYDDESTALLREALIESCGNHGDYTYTDVQSWECE